MKSQPLLPAVVALRGFVLAAVLSTAGPVWALDCRQDAQRELQKLGVTAEEISSIRYVEKYNPAEQGPDVLGVRAWIRLKACASGYLVVDMTRSCFVRQSYTRGECRREGITAY
jgi:hypothetical protein